MSASRNRLRGAKAAFGSSRAKTKRAAEAAPSACRRHRFSREKGCLAENGPWIAASALSSITPL